MGRLRESRGRGNQGDWVNNRAPCDTLKEHDDHNAAVEAKRQAKKAAKKTRKPK